MCSDGEQESIPVGCTPTAAVASILGERRVGYDLNPGYPTPRYPTFLDILPPGYSNSGYPSPDIPLPR